MNTSSLVGRARALQSAPVVAVFDLDRTITRSGTYTPFLVHCMPPTVRTLRRSWAALRITTAFGLGLMSRDDAKARMIEVNIAGASRAQVASWADGFVAKSLRSRVRPGALVAIERHKAA